MSEPISNKIPIAIFIFLLAITPNTVRSEEKKDTQMTVFCTNNKDGTGSCLTSLQEPVECILIPGSIVECTDKDKSELACVSVHSTSAILEISCEKPKAIIKQTEITEIPVMSEEPNPESKSNNSGELESTLGAEPATSDRLLQEDTTESPFTDPF